MQTIRITNWDKYQAFKDGRPMQWGKLYASIIDDYDFCEQLSEVQQAHFIKLLALAMKTGNAIPADPKWIAKKISAKSPVDLQALEEHGFIEQTIDSTAERTESYESVRIRTRSTLLSSSSKEEEAKSKSNIRATQFPHESLPDDWRDYCAEKRPDLDPQTTFENCRDYWIGHGKPMKNWLATWQRWVRNERAPAKPEPKTNANRPKLDPSGARPGESWDEYEKRMRETRYA